LRQTLASTFFEKMRNSQDTFNEMLSWWGGLKIKDIGSCGRPGAGRHLVAKVQHTRRWRVTERGRHLLGLAVQLYRETWPALAA